MGVLKLTLVRPPHTSDPLQLAAARRNRFSIHMRCSQKIVFPAIHSCVQIHIHSAGIMVKQPNIMQALNSRDTPNGKEPCAQAVPRGWLTTINHSQKRKKEEKKATAKNTHLESVPLPIKAGSLLFTVARTGCQPIDAASKIKPPQNGQNNGIYG